MMGMHLPLQPVQWPPVDIDGCSYALRPEKIREEVKRGVQVILTSNPRNPTGHMVKGETLKEIMDICRGRCTLIMDEFYSAYNYTGECDGTRISCSDYVEDVDVDDGGLFLAQLMCSTMLITASAHS